MATGEDRPKYTHYSLAQPRDREHISRLYGSERAQNGSFPTNIVQCLQLDHVGSRSRPKHFRQQYVNGGLARAKYLYSQDVLGHTGCVNAINFSNLGEDLLITGTDIHIHAYIHVHTLSYIHSFIHCVLVIGFCVAISWLTELAQAHSNVYIHWRSPQVGMMRRCSCGRWQRW